MKRITILSQSHLCRNPRVIKEANSLAKAGYKVTILTTFVSESLLKEDLKLIREDIQYIGVTNLIPRYSSKLYIFKHKAIRRLGVELIGSFGIESPLALGYNCYGFLSMCMQLSSDIYIAHQEMATWVGCELIKKGYKVAFDLEDWYSNDLLPEARKFRPIKMLREIEKFALNNGLFTFTTSDIMAIHIAKAYNSPQPLTLYNVFSFRERKKIDHLKKDRKDLSKPSLIWFSQTIGPGRGLELLFQALSIVDIPVEVHLRGDCSEEYKKKLINKFPYKLNHCLFFHDIVPNDELVIRLAEHDIGLALEQTNPPSRNLTVTNKILQYLLAGLAVIASDTLGQREVAEKAKGAVYIYKNDSHEELALQISKLIKNEMLLANTKHNSVTASENFFCWEKQEYKLLSRLL